MDIKDFSKVIVNNSELQTIFVNGLQVWSGGWQDLIEPPNKTEFEVINEPLVASGTQTITLGDDAAANRTLIYNTLINFGAPTSWDNKVYTLNINSSNKYVDLSQGAIALFMTNLIININGTIFFKNYTGVFTSGSGSPIRYLTINGKMVIEISQAEKATDNNNVIGVSIYNGDLELTIRYSNALTGSNYYDNPVIKLPKFNKGISQVYPKLKINIENPIGADISKITVTIGDNDGNSAYYYLDFTLNSPAVDSSVIKGFIPALSMYNAIPLQYVKFIDFINFNLTLPTDNIFKIGYLRGGTFIFRNINTNVPILIQRYNETPIQTDGFVPASQINNEVNFPLYFQAPLLSKTSFIFEALLEDTTNEYIPVKMKNAIWL